MPDATVHLVAVADLGAHLPPHHALFGADVGPDGRLWTSWVPRASLEAIWDDGGVIAAGAAQVFAVGTAGVERIVVPALPLPVAHAQPLPGGEVVCVARWCRRYRDGTADPNAFVVSAGQLVAQHVIGDDVDHVATTPEGLIWASYDDEGIFGNRGWQHAIPLGSSGLVAWDREGRRVYSLDLGPLGEARDGPSVLRWPAFGGSIETVGDLVYVRRHPGDVLLALREGRVVEHWTGGPGPEGGVLCVGDAHVVIDGDHPADSWEDARVRLHVLRREEGRLEEVGAVDLQLDGRPVRRGDLRGRTGGALRGRGRDVYAVVGTVVGHVDVVAVLGARDTTPPPPRRA